MVRTYDARVGDSGSRVRAFAGRAATFVKARPRSQQLVGGGLALALVTAPFGGFESVSASAPLAEVRAGQPLEIGPFEVTVKKAVTVPDLAPTITPAEGNALFVIVATVANVHDQPEHWVTLGNALHLDDPAIITEDDDGRRVSPRVFDYVDASSIDVINPGMAHELVLAWEVSGELEDRQVGLAVDEVLWREQHPTLNIFEFYWEDLDRPVARGLLDVEARA